MDAHARLMNVFENIISTNVYTICYNDVPCDCLQTTTLIDSLDGIVHFDARQLPCAVAMHMPLIYRTDAVKFSHAYHGRLPTSYCTRCMYTVRARVRRPAVCAFMASRRCDAMGAGRRMAVHRAAT